MACNLPRTIIVGMDGVMRQHKITNTLLAEKAGVNYSTIHRARQNLLIVALF